MNNVTDFQHLKNTKGTYNKVLKVAQKITTLRVEELIDGKPMSPYTLDEREIISLSDTLSEVHKLPTSIRRMRKDISFYVELAQKYPAKR